MADKISTVKVVTQRFIYDKPLSPPIDIGTLLDVDPVTAAFWVKRGIARYPGDASQSAQHSAALPAGVKPAPPPPAPEMTPPPKPAGQS